MLIESSNWQSGEMSWVAVNVIRLPQNGKNYVDVEMIQLPWMQFPALTGTVPLH